MPSRGRPRPFRSQSTNPLLRPRPDLHLLSPAPTCTRLAFLPPVACLSLLLPPPNRGHGYKCAAPCRVPERDRRREREAVSPCRAVPCSPDHLSRRRGRPAKFGSELISSQPLLTASLQLYSFRCRFRFAQPAGGSWLGDTSSSEEVDRHEGLID